MFHTAHPLAAHSQAGLRYKHMFRSMVKNVSHLQNGARKYPGNMYDWYISLLLILKPYISFIFFLFIYIVNIFDRVLTCPNMTHIFNQPLLN